MLQETHLVEKYAPRVSGYTIVRKDRSIYGDGLATLIRNNLEFDELQIVVPEPIEAQFFSIFGIQFANIYVPPTSVTISFRFLGK